MVVGPDWNGETPPQIKQVFRSSTQFSIAIFRTQLFTCSRHAKCGQSPVGIQIQSLSAFLKQTAPPAPPESTIPKPMPRLRRHNSGNCWILLCSLPRQDQRKSLSVRSWQVSASAPASVRHEGLSEEHKAAVLLG